MSAKLTDFTFEVLGAGKEQFQKAIKDLCDKKALVEMITSQRHSDESESVVFNELVEMYDKEIEPLHLLLVQFEIAMQEVSKRERVNDN